MPAHSELTEEKALQICELLAHGCTREHSAEALGISRMTLYRWIRRGKEETEGLFVTFVTLLKEAEAQAINKRIIKIEAAGDQGSWQAHGWYLERCLPDRFALRDRKAWAELTAELKEMRAEIRELRQQNEASGQAGEAGAFRRNGHATGQGTA